MAPQQKSLLIHGTGLFSDIFHDGRIDSCMAIILTPATSKSSIAVLLTRRLSQFDLTGEFVDSELLVAAAVLGFGEDSVANRHSPTRMDAASNVLS